MPIKLVSLNVRGLRDWSKAARLLRDLLSFGVAAIQETHFVCDIDACVLSSDRCLFSIRGPAGQRCFLVSQVFSGCKCRPCTCGCGGPVGCGQYFREQWFAVYAPNNHGEHVNFFPLVGAIPGRFISLNGGLEYHPEPPD